MPKSALFKHRQFHFGAFTVMFFTAAWLHAAQNVELVTPNIKSEPSPAAPAAGTGKLDEDRLAGLEMKMMRVGEEGRLSDEELRRRMTLIETSPDLGPYLVEVADRMIAQKSDYVRDVLNAIAQRKDIDPKAIERYVVLTEEILAQVKSSTELDRSQRSILYGMNDVLAAYPSATSERLLIRMQQIGLGGLVAESLAKIGGPQALAALQEQVMYYEERVKNEPDNEGLRVKTQRVRDCMENLRVRLMQTARKPGGATLNPVGTHQSATREQQLPDAEGKPPGSIKPWHVLLLLGLVVILCIIFAWQRFIK